MAQREIDLDCVFTTPIRLFTVKERPECLVCLCLRQCSSPGDMGCGSGYAVGCAGKDLEVNERRVTGVFSRH